MPYIDQRARDALTPHITNLAFAVKTHGELNYVITRLCQSFHPMSYEDYSALVGDLECCKLEFYRRAVAAYEDEKIVSNGDVY
jgi:hypothetical protein